MCNKVKVVIIDTGVNDRLIKGVCFSLNGENVVLSSQIEDDIGHGTGIFVSCCISGCFRYSIM